MNKQDTIELACQIVFEYPQYANDGGETIDEIMRTYNYEDPAPCNGDQLYSACLHVQESKDAGKSYQDCYNTTTVNAWVVL